MSSKKIPLNMNVLEAARERIEWAFNTFPSVCLSFSGGKDSTVLFHITANIARKLNKKFSVLFIDWEVQFQHTINHVMNMQRLYRDSISHFYWIALPLTTVSGVSQYQPEWISWEKGIKWIRKPPKFSITEYDYFPFYHYAMTFEEFVPAFSAWLSADTGMITLTGMRADESLKRFTSIISVTKKRSHLINHGLLSPGQVITVLHLHYMTGKHRIYGFFMHAILYLIIHFMILCIGQGCL